MKTKIEVKYFNLSKSKNSLRKEMFAISRLSCFRRSQKMLFPSKLSRQNPVPTISLRRYSDSGPVADEKLVTSQKSASQKSTSQKSASPTNETDLLRAQIAQLEQRLIA